jgi:hypothetical protein
VLDTIGLWTLISSDQSEENRVNQLMMLGIKEKSSNYGKNVKSVYYFFMNHFYFTIGNLFGCRTTYIYTVSPIFKSI